VRPDSTCIESGSVKPLQKPHVECRFSTTKDQKRECTLYNDLLKEYQQNEKTPQDLITAKKYSRRLIWEFFCKCIKFTLSNTEVKCSRCGECCKAFSRKEYKTDANKSCKPGKNNPCTKLEGTEIPYTCGVYETDFRKCVDYPDGTVYGLFMEVLNGNFFAKMEGGVVKITITPNCVYEFERGE